MVSYHILSWCSLLACVLNVCLLTTQFKRTFISTNAKDIARDINLQAIEFCNSTYGVDFCCRDKTKGAICFGMGTVESFHRIRFLSTPVP